MNVLRHLLASAALACVFACARTTLPIASPADVDRAATRWPGITAAELASGRTLYAGHCGGCHVPISPTSVHPESWPEHVGEMRERAGLDEREALLVERYLVTMATGGRTASASAVGVR